MISPTLFRSLCDVTVPICEPPRCVTPTTAQERRTKSLAAPVPAPAPAPVPAVAPAPAPAPRPARAPALRLAPALEPTALQHTLYRWCCYSSSRLQRSRCQVACESTHLHQASCSWRTHLQPPFLPLPPSNSSLLRHRLSSSAWPFRSDNEHRLLRQLQSTCASSRGPWPAAAPQNPRSISRLHAPANCNCRQPNPLPRQSISTAPMNSIQAFKATTLALAIVRVLVRMRMRAIAIGRTTLMMLMERLLDSCMVWATRGQWREGVCAMRERGGRCEGGGGGWCRSALALIST